MAAWKKRKLVTLSKVCADYAGGARAKLLPIQEVYSAPSQATALSEVFQRHGVNCMGLLAFFTTRTEVELRASSKIRKLVTFPQVCVDYEGALGDIEGGEPWHPGKRASL